MEEERKEETPAEEGTVYEMKEVQNTGHEHKFSCSGTDSQGWEIWTCPCGAGYGTHGTMRT